MADGPSPRPDLVKMAICAGTLGQIEWKPQATENMRKDPRMQGFTTSGVRNLLRDCVLNKNGTVHPRSEKDDDWLEEHPEDPWWYKVVIEVVEFPQGIMVKMKLVDPDEENDPWVQIIGCHP